jgi:hypothetical protein
MFASMERVMSESLGKLQQNTQESSSMKELLEMYKTRCEFLPVSPVKIQAREIGVDYSS